MDSRPGPADVGPLPAVLAKEKMIGIRSRYPNALATSAGTALLLAAVLTVAACGDDDESSAKNDTDEPSAADQVATTGSDAQVEPIVGRWQQLQTCRQLVDGLNAERLGAIAPAIVGDYFPGQT